MTRGTIFDIQHYAVHDGPGIRTLVFLKGCPLACAWCCNPESQRADRELRHIGARCQACLRCVRACPHGAITGGKDGPRIDRGRCPPCPGAPCVDACCSGALAISGETIGVDTLVARVAADLPFYRNSDGGVTFSGGEPFAQPAFLREALRRCRDRGIHTAVETCGLADPGDIRDAAPLIDLFLFDVKLVDPARHREVTGAGNELILRNLTDVASLAPGRVVLRFPVIPGFTDAPGNIEDLADLAIRLGIGTVDLEPYHPLGRGKYAEIGRESPPDIAQPDPGGLAAIQNRFTRRGLRCELA